MVWFKVDDGFYDHPKVMDLPDSAVALWTRAGAYCGKHLTDGRIPARTARRLCDNPDQAIAALIDAGLWKQDADGSYRFHDWDDYQPSREEAEERHQARAEGAEWGNHVRWHVKRSVINPECPHCARSRDRSTDQLADRSPDQLPDQSTIGIPNPPTRPDPTRPITLPGGAPDGRAALPGMPEPQPPPEPSWVGTLVGEYAKAVAGKASPSAKARVGATLRAAADRGVSAGDAQTALREWMAKGHGPGTLQSFIDGVVNRRAMTRPANDNFWEH